MAVLHPTRSANVQLKAALPAAEGRRANTVPLDDDVQNDSPSRVAVKRALVPPDASVDVSHEPSAAQTATVKVPLGFVVSLSSWAKPTSVRKRPSSERSRPPWLVVTPRVSRCWPFAEAAAAAAVAGSAMERTTVPKVASGATETSSRKAFAAPASAAPLACGPARSSTMLPGVKGEPLLCAKVSARAARPPSSSSSASARAEHAECAERAGA